MLIEVRWSLQCFLQIAIAYSNKVSKRIFPWLLSHCSFDHVHPNNGSIKDIILLTVSPPQLLHKFLWYWDLKQWNFVNPVSEYKTLECSFALFYSYACYRRKDLRKWEENCRVGQPGLALAENRTCFRLSNVTQVLHAFTYLVIRSNIFLIKERFVYEYL